MNKPNLVTVSILPHLKKFIYKFYDLPKDQPVKVEMTSSMGIAMKFALRDKKKLHRNYSDKLNEESIQFELCHRLKKLSLSPALIKSFNQHYHRIFKEQMRLWVMAQWEVGINNRQAIMSFLKYFNIKENEYSYESAQRDWLRFKNKESKNNGAMLS